MWSWVLNAWLHAFQYICTSILNLFEMYYSGNDVRQKLKYKENLNMFFFLICWSKNGSFTHLTDVSLVAHRTVTDEGWVAPGCPLTDPTVEAGPLSTGVSIICRKWWTQVWIDFCIQGKFSPMLFSPFYTKKRVCPVLNTPTQSCVKS